MRKTIILLIRFYQRFLSPLKPPAYRCRYYPSCSQYTIEALTRFGVGRGVVLGIVRLLSCHPWSQGAVDQVPETWPGWKGIFRRKRGL
ncbi:membrane protein insertion efficiency factor YidD [Capillibacterium thermochitinicola]|uniref:Putative membrane protein insertion efficiency factor n=1 Tax=Capillibacterium thermochitinicola TaxID=2699427 RepID=A0A8J6LM34_9FIRM|nr:membrane protein insertion efficiency factor YidD [Capillibacterium thermochitinicola]MBA2133219.1 membrane protein insertion efficiency factor YidD [Capillibacterium thermochitinicola]